MIQKKIEPNGWHRPFGSKLGICYRDLIIASALAVTIPAAWSASTTTTTAETATATRRTLFARTGKVYRKGTTAEVFPMEHGNGALGFLRGGHLNKAKAF
jgi:hypothetical protein